MPATRPARLSLFLSTTIYALKDLAKKIGSETILSLAQKIEDKYNELLDYYNKAEQYMTELEDKLRCATPPPAVTTVPTTARQVLDYIDAFLASGSYVTAEQRKLWDILTALRGPDDTDHQGYKYATTGLIRGTAFPKAAAANRIQGDCVSSDSTAYASARAELQRRSASGLLPRAGHFTSHVKEAFGGLGLKFASSNAPAEPVKPATFGGGFDSIFSV